MGNKVLEGILQFDVEVLVEVDNTGVEVVVEVGVGIEVDCKYIHHVVVVEVEDTVVEVVAVVVDSHNLLEMEDILQFFVEDKVAGVGVVGVVGVFVGMGMVVDTVVGMGVGVLGVGDSYFLVVGVLESVVVDDDYDNVHDDERRLQHEHAPRRSADASIYRFEFLV